MIPVPQVRTFPVIETFGPTIAGEGVLAGLPTYFVRFGLCDYRCSWCDSKYAVEPSEVKANAAKLTARDIVDRVLLLDGGPHWVTLSGGNPAMHRLDDVLGLLQDFGYLVAVETQGSLWNAWLGAVNSLTVSPKPPSSGMADKTEHDLPGFMEKARAAGRGVGRMDALKIVVFDETDYEWAAEVIARYDDFEPYISAGTPTVAQWGSDVHEAVSDNAVRAQIGERYAWLCDKVSHDRRFTSVRVLPQLHIIAYGHRRGV